MINPATILRDASIAGLVLSLAGGVMYGAEFSGAVAAGALGSLVNLFLLWRAVSGAGVAADGFVLARLGFKTMVGALILVLLVANFPVAPVLVGFCSVLLGLAARGFWSLRSGTRAPTLEPG